MIQKVGQQTRQNYKLFYSSSVDKLWTLIFAISRTFLRSKDKVTVAHKQFPLEPSAAKTIHKSKGSTYYDKIVVDLGSTKLAHAHYVALSTVRSLAGLNILRLNYNNITVDKQIDQEINRPKKNPLKLCYTPVYHYPQSSFKILFHNV